MKANKNNSFNPPQQKQSKTQQTIDQALFSAMMSKPQPKQQQQQQNTKHQGSGKNKCSWIDFVKEYAGAKNISYKEALVEAKPHYHKCKEMMGGGILSTIGDYIWKYLAKPVGSAYAKSIFRGSGIIDDALSGSDAYSAFNNLKGDEYNIFDNPGVNTVSKKIGAVSSALQNVGKIGQDVSDIMGSGKRKRKY